MKCAYVEINIKDIYRESFFYLDWANKCKNEKTKKKLLLKSIKELKKLNVYEAKKRVRISILKNGGIKSAVH